MKNCNSDTVIPENTFLAEGPGGEQMEQFTGQCEKSPLTCLKTTWTTFLVKPSCKMKCR